MNSHILSSSVFIFFQVDQREKNKERTERELKSQHPLLSRIKPWLKRQLKRADEDHSSQHIWDAHIKAIGKEFFPKDLYISRSNKPKITIFKITIFS